MSDPEHSYGDPEDLIVKARRGRLETAEQRALERALDVNPSLRIARLVGTEMDRATAARAGDDELVLSAARAALDRFATPAGDQRSASAHPRRIHSLVGAGMVGLVVIGAAGWLGLGVVPARQDLPRAGLPAVMPGQSGHDRPVVSHASPHAGPGSDRAASETAAEATPAERVNVDRDGVAHARPGVARRSRGPLPPTAAELFHRANAARRGADFAGAKRGYSELIARYPQSDEAQLAQVSLGKLLLAEGASAKAEREFRRYLADGRGQLGEEALVSWAHSLLRMQRNREERQVWQRLLAEHPNSVYATQARQRLEALSAIGAAAGR